MQPNAPAAPRSGTAALVGAAALPGALVAYMSFESGGYFAGAPALVAAELAVLIALRVALVRRPLAGAGRLLVAAALALGAFAAWTLASSGWSDGPARAIPEYTRALAYCLTLVFFGVLPFCGRRVRWMTFGLAGAIVVICLTALVSRTLPDVLDRVSTLHPERLAYPLDYWNALGLLSGVGVVLCGHFACAARDHPLVRVAGAAVVPALALTLYYTYSRGALWATMAAVVLYVAVGRPRGLVSGALATLPTTAIALMAAHPATDLAGAKRLGEPAVAAGHRVALVLAACMVAAGLLRALLVPLDRRLEAFGVPARLGRRMLASATACLLVVSVAGAVALHVPEKVAAKYREFNSDSAVPGQSGTDRLLSANDNGRREHWEVALRGFREDRLHGAGAGTYELTWARFRQTPTAARDGHSLYVETLGELGLVGLGALALCLLLILWGFARRARGRDRPLFAALLAVGVLWGLAAAVDWAWEMPAVTIWLFALGGASLAVPDRGGPRGSRWRSRPASVAIRGVAVAACLALAVLPARVAVSHARLGDSLDAMHDGDCGAARAAARRSLDALDRRAAPHHVIAWCAAGEGRYRVAVAALARALRNDPGNWALLQASAVARAAAGLDPRPQARLAARLNPRSELAGYTRLALTGNDRARWKRAGGRLPSAIPELTDP